MAQPAHKAVTPYCRNGETPRRWTSSRASLSNRRIWQIIALVGLAAASGAWLLGPARGSFHQAWWWLSVGALAAVIVRWPRCFASVSRSRGRRKRCGAAPDSNSALPAANRIADSADWTVQEEQQRQAQKMEAIGRLAGGVAHDFNNLLTVISGYSDMLLESLAKTGPEREMVEHIKKSSERATSLTRQLLAFSRKQVLKPRLVDLSVLVRDIDDMLRRLIREDIELTTSTHRDPLPVVIDAGQMEQVLMNLVINARDAMPHGGTIAVATTRTERAPRRPLRAHDLQAGPVARLTVNDTGCGMNAETIKHIFEPFFTTKENGKGTGLGLSTVYGIVRQSGGRIGVSSTEGVGTTFEIDLPLATETPLVEEAVKDRSSAAAGGTETVLLVEDEDDVRALARRALQERGYRVIEARNGLEAIVRCRQQQGPIDLVLTDVIMPHLGGPELVERLQRLHPTIKTIYMSGYTDSNVVHDSVSGQIVSFISKPFTSEELAFEVRSVLDEREDATEPENEQRPASNHRALTGLG